MIITKYGITLERINHTHLEKLRTWRNSSYVRNQMFYQEKITPKMQEQWFNDLNPFTNYYFIATYNKKEVGVINIKNIENNAGEGGIFLINDKFENAEIVPRMIVCFNDFVFYQLELEYIWSKVKQSNKKAISSSIAQGCIKVASMSTEETIYFKLTSLEYEKKIKKIKKILCK
jgi:hypothetical protein